MRPCREVVGMVGLSGLSLHAAILQREGFSITRAQRSRPPALRPGVPLSYRLVDSTGNPFLKRPGTSLAASSTRIGKPQKKVLTILHVLRGSSQEGLWLIQPILGIARVDVSSPPKGSNNSTTRQKAKNRNNS